MPPSPPSLPAAADAASLLPTLQVGEVQVALGDAVLLAAEEDDEGAPLALVQAMWQTADGAPPLAAASCKEPPGSHGPPALQASPLHDCRCVQV